VRRQQAPWALRLARPIRKIGRLDDGHGQQMLTDGAFVADGLVGAGNRLGEGLGPPAKAAAPIQYVLRPAEEQSAQLGSRRQQPAVAGDETPGCRYRAVFQMDQTAPADQSLFRHKRKCRQDSGLDSRVGVCAGCNFEKASGPQSEPLQNPADFKPRTFRQKAHFTGVF